MCIRDRVSSGAKRIMIDTINTALDEYDEETIYISGYYRGDKAEYSFKKQDLVKKFLDENGNLSIKRGDVVLVDINDKNEITAMSIERAFSEDMGNKHLYGGKMCIRDSVITFALVYI